MQRSQSLTTELADLVGRQARRVVAAVSDPRLRALRRRRRARRATVLRSGVAVLAGTVTAVLGPDPELELSEVAAGSATALAALAAVAAGVRWFRLHRSPLPTARPASPAALPPPGSVAREPMVRLAAAETGLVDLLVVLARPRHGVAVVPPEILESTRVALDEAVAELRGTAEAICAVERAAGSAAPAAERTGLLDAVTALRRRLDEGVDEVCGLVVAAGAVVSAAGPEPRPAVLAEATDRLAGLAEGLRELSHRPG